ncbi:MAG: GlxA family transcriptional regulator [Silicimonas sp.]|nr:GlxA family transcriptional regulator [Silicimonas sp.]
MTRLAVVVLPNFNLSATMNFIDPFRVANYLDGTQHFAWEFLSEEGGALTASNGARLDTRPLDQAAPADFAIISSSWEPEAHISPALCGFLRQAALRQATLIGLDTGAFVLAHAGLLSGHRATVHYEHMDAFQEIFPDIQLSETLWEIDRARITCAGGAAATDLALHLLQGLKSAALSNAAARYIFAPRRRDHNAPQNPGDAEPLGAIVPEVLRRAIRVMEAHLEATLSMGEVCDHIGLSHRQLDRLFKQYVGKPPALYYRDIRLDRARGLVTQTSLSMAEIAVASGFSSQVHFSRAYRQRFGLPPSRDRVEGRIPFEFRAWPMHRRAREAAKNDK